ncbi:MAG: Uma2 family endonuclease [Chloroflexi bacterium]|nr:Uma2 family endonuclease [Chloroflexota bacterium]
MVIERVQKMSVEEFLHFAESSEEWHEYIDGELYPMTTPTLRHNIIGNNIAFSLRSLLAGKNCHALGMGQGVRVGATRFLIPDVCVVCDQPLLETDTRILLNPVLVGEVTSPTTVNIDRGAKRDFYFQAPSIEIYLVVDQDRLNVELHTRDGAGWRTVKYSKIDDELLLEALNCSLSLRDIYRNVKFETRDSSDANEAEVSS